MAGIGFELKRLYNKEGLTSKIVASVQSLFVIFGPYLINILLILLLIIISRSQNTDLTDFNNFMSIIVYGFLYSQIITSGSSIGMTKFVSDQMYEKNTTKLLYPFMITLAVTLFISMVITLVINHYFEIDKNILISIYFLYSLLIILRLQSIYLSALKNYKVLGLIYLSTVVLILPIYYMVEAIGFSNPVYVYLLSFILVMFLSVFSLMVVIYAMLPKQENCTKEYVRSLRKTRHVRLMNVFLTVSIFASVAIYWFAEGSVVSYELFRTNPRYDYTFFIANISLIPAMIYFVVNTETQLFIQVRRFFDTLNNNYPLSEVENEKEVLVSVIRKELQVFSVIQFAATLFFLLIAYIFLGRSFDSDQLAVMSYYLFGSMLFIIIQIVTFVLLYMAAYKEVMYVGFSLLSLVILTNSIAYQLGYVEPALMLVYSAGFGLIIAILILERYLKNLYFNIYK